MCTAGIKGILDDSCNISLAFQIEKEDSCIEVRASFNKDIRSDADFSKFQNMAFRFDANGLEHEDALAFKQVKTLDDAPPSLQQVSKVKTMVERGELFSLTIEFNPELIVGEGIEDARAFNTPRKIQAADVFRTIDEKTEFTVYAQLTKKMQAALEILEKKMSLEYQARKFPEYMGQRTGNYVLQWGNEKFNEPGIDKLVRPPVDTFNDIQHWRITHGYGVMREAQWQILHTMQTLDNDMTAYFVEWLKQIPDATDSLCRKYLTFLKCDNEELIKLAYNVGTKGVLCFEKSDPEAANRPVGWQYRIWPSLPDFEYPGNLVLEVNRPKDDDREIPTNLVPSLDMKDITVWAFPETTQI
ncbi:MAG: hypothetical protein Q9166_004704 [cf. Caloplaca sp. 2 TL-2023]